ncbi:DUF2637 domain-containing protein [Streptomyces sp. LP05-1]|uniref:DUF2637 domain-containing protein n=1 Tax=Streptomyces pyxinae TaxID=2970734 RepID=A0ABT2CN56_9ACTN|nr:DUF2637 domain-containing protein [Streptomyces sp. LP05-1]
MPSLSTTAPLDTAPTALPALIRTGVALMAVAAFALSYDALRQMAAASHIHRVLTYAFPLVIDGFIAIGVGALLVLRTAPVRSRRYVGALVGVATFTSIWANVLHAVRLNQQTQRDGLALDNITVGVISGIAPLALAGAVHFYLIVQRRPIETELREDLRHITVDTDSERGATATNEPTADKRDVAQAPAGHVAQAPVGHVAQAPVGQVAQPRKPAATGRGQRPIVTFEQAVEIGRTASLGRGGRVSRRNVEGAIRDKGFGVGRERLDQVKSFLQEELDQSRDATST